jgi:tetratricopeptide (TPR) repeat protein
MSKLLTLITVSMVLSFVTARAQKLFGYVLEQNSGKKPVPGAMVRAAFANQTSTTDDGSFTLSFQNAIPGYNAVLTIEKEKWIITEKNRLEVNLPLDPFNHPHTIIMCRADVWAKQNQENLKLLNKILKETLQKQKSALNKQSVDYQKIVDSLDEQFVKSRRSLGELTEALSRVNLDDVSETEKAAYAYFAEGKIDECILLRQTLQSEKNLLLANQRLKQLNETPQKSDSAFINIRNTIALHRRNLKEEINLAKLRFDWKTAERKLKFLAENDSTDHENLLRYGEFLQSQNEFDKAETIFKTALTIYTRLQRANPGAFSSNLAAVLYSLGTILKNKYQYEAAENALKQAFSLYKQLVNADPATYSKDFGQALTELASLHANKRFFSQAENEFKQALTIYKPLEQTNPAEYDAAVAGTQNNLGVLYLKAKNYKVAETVFKEALGIRKQLNNISPLSNETEIGEIQNNLGYVYLCQKKYDAAKVALENALTIFKKFQQTSPMIFDPFVASVQTNLASLYTEQSDLGTYDVQKNDSAAAHGFFNQAVALRKRLVITAPDVYEPELAETYRQFGFFFNEDNDRDSAEVFYTDAILIYEKFAKLVPEEFDLLLAATQQKLGKVYLLRNSNSAGVLFKRALAIYKHHSLANREDLEDEIASCLYDIALTDYYSRIFYSSQENEIRQSLQQFKDVLDAYNRLDKKNPGNYAKDIKSVQNFIVKINNKLKEVQAQDPSRYIQRTEKEKIESELDYLLEDIESAATIYNKLILQQLLVEKKREYLKKDKFSDVISFGHDLNDLSWYLLFSKKYSEAEEAAREAISPGFKKPESYDKEMEYAKANLAVSLLLQNKFEEAKKIYVSLKNKSFDGKTFVSIFLDDIAQLEKAGINHPDFEKIKSVLVE